MSFGVTQTLWGGGGGAGGGVVRLQSGEVFAQSII